MTQWTATRTCPLCEATCGLELTLEDDRIVKVRGQEDHVFSRGYLCPKGATFGELEHDPDRLTRPRIRERDGWRDASWDEALAFVADRLQPLIAEHGPDAVGVYLGNPNVHNLSGQLYNRALLRALGTRNVFTASTVDQMPKHRSCIEMFGDPLAIPVPDVDRTDLLLMLGANPLMSNGSLLTAPDLPGRLKALRERGGRLVVVDPRRSRTAAKADLHLAIRPGTDALLLLALANVLVEEDLVDPGDHLLPHLEGLDVIREAVLPWTPERAAERCGLAPEVIRQVARDLAAAERAVVYGRIGTTTTSFGTLTSWLVDVLNVLTGNLDRAGGAMFPRTAHDDRTGFPPTTTGRHHSRVSGHPEIMHEYPAAALAEEIDTPGEGRIRALVCVAANPVISVPDGDRLDRALDELDLFVAVDPYVTATSRKADVILPPPGARFRGHYDLAFAGLAVRNVAAYSPPVLPMPADALDEWEILLRLGAAAQGQPDVDPALLDDLVAVALAGQLHRRPAARTGDLTPEELVAAVAPRRGPERLLDLLLRSGPYGDAFGGDPDGLTLEQLEATPEGIDLGPLQPRLPQRLATASGKVELAPEPLLEDLDRLDAWTDEPVPEVVLVGRRHVRTNNSWSHNVAALRGTKDLCTLHVHPDDAVAWGLGDGGSATVTSTTGKVTVPVEITEDIRRGVVSLPHGFGHDLDGIEQTVATADPGVNVNRIVPGSTLDPLGGTSALNAVPVTVTPA